MGEEKGKSNKKLSTKQLVLIHIRVVPSIYDPLKSFLEKQTVKSITFAFGEIEAIIGRELPRAAYDTDGWWWTGQPAWLNAGWRVVTLNRGNENVRFSR